jgi:hypothetical protein
MGITKIELQMVIHPEEGERKELSVDFNGRLLEGLRGMADISALEADLAEVMRRAMADVMAVIAKNTRGPG